MRQLLSATVAGLLVIVFTTTASAQNYLALFDSNGRNGRRTIRLKYLHPSCPTALLLISERAPMRGMRPNSNTIPDGRSINALRLATRIVPGQVPLFLGSTLYQNRS